MHLPETSSRGPHIDGHMSLFDKLGGLRSPFRARELDGLTGSPAPLACSVCHCPAAPSLSQSSPQKLHPMYSGLAASYQISGPQ